MTAISHKEQFELREVYLNDHLMGACGGVELARRLARTYRDPDGRKALEGGL